MRGPKPVAKLASYEPGDQPAADHGHHRYLADEVPRVTPSPKAHPRSAPQAEAEPKFSAVRFDPIVQSAIEPRSSAAPRPFAIFSGVSPDCLLLDEGVRDAPPSSAT